MARIVCKIISKTVHIRFFNLKSVILISYACIQQKKKKKTQILKEPIIPLDRENCIFLE